MHLKTDDIIRLEIEFDSGSIPPPFSHTYKIKTGFEKDFVNTQFDITYTEREELSEDEIYEEGFTPEDDYSFKGELPKIWESPFKTLYGKTNWSNKKNLDENGGIKILAKDKHGKIVRGIPSNPEEWQYLAQEFIQGIYEINQKEAPLTLQYYVNDSQEGELFYELTVKFSVRKIELSINGKSINVSWESVKALLGFVFLPDYDYDQAQEKKPNKRGHYIHLGDGFWHEFGKGIINIDDTFDATSKIKSEFRKLNKH
ncbi:hypothetical protein [Anditalea andensis]|uniref:Uncharacterized protein n=1 Tax=Anditalea andensis TaxID=1048983 RepID=A0A074KX98_9BACT|nr:hypothetical protein [Anditalea andensis]KEO74591.1 hypothetical protein EL17_02640 [Anditalea andensis]